MDVTIDQKALLSAVKKLEPYLTMAQNDLPYIFLVAVEDGLWLYAIGAFRVTFSAVYYPTKVVKQGSCLLSSTLFSQTLKQMDSGDLQIKTDKDNSHLILTQKSLRIRIQQTWNPALSIPTVNEAIKKLDSMEYGLTVIVDKSLLMRLIRLSDLYPEHMFDKNRWVILEVAEDGLLQCSTQDTEVGKVEALELEARTEGHGKVILDTDQLKIALGFCSESVFFRSGTDCPALFSGSGDDGSQWWSSLAQWRLIEREQSNDTPF